MVCAVELLPGSFRRWHASAPVRADFGTMRLLMQRLKSHRVHLYLLRPDGERGMFQSLGSAHGFLPSLWQVLLADATPLPAARTIVGGDSTQWIASDADAAVSRYREFMGLVARHPCYLQVAGLDRYLHGARDYLEETIAQWRAAGAAAPRLCLDLACLPPDPVTAQSIGYTATDYTAIDYTAQLRTFRRELESIVQAGDCDRIEALLRFPSRLLRFTDWRAWSGMFGLAQLEPHYFSAAFRQPFPECFADHDYDEFGSEATLGHGRYRLRRGACWGVATDADGLGCFTLQPEWDRILRTGHGNSEGNSEGNSGGDSERVWVERGGRYALASSHDGRLFTEVILDEVHGFRHGVAIVRVGARYGLLDTTGGWRLRPSLDEIHPFANGLAVARSHGKFGYIDLSGATAIAMQFDNADDFNAAGIARVSLNGRCGLLRRDGRMALPLTCDRIEWRMDFSGWLCERAGTVWLTHANGDAWVDDVGVDNVGVDAGWTSMDVLVRDQWIRAWRGERVGLLSWGGDLLLPCDFRALSLRSVASVTPGNAQISRSRRWALQKIRAAMKPAPIMDSRGIVARREGRLGLFDAQLRLTVPFEFSRIEALEPHVEGDLQLSIADLVRVRSMPGAAAPRVGVWSIAQQRCVVPCAYDYVWTCLFDAEGRYGYIVGNRNPKRGCSTQGRYRVGLLRADGSVLVPQRYAWLAESTPLNRDDAVLDIRSTLYHYWSRGEPVRASINEKGPQISLDASGLEHSAADSDMPSRGENTVAAPT